MPTPLEREITVLEALENSYLDAVTNASGKLCYCRHEPEIRSILKDLLTAAMTADAMYNIRIKQKEEQWARTLATIQSDISDLKSTD